LTYLSAWCCRRGGRAGTAPGENQDRGGEVRQWRINLRTTSDIAELAEWMNPVIRGWMTCYGRFYRTELHGLLKRINTYLVRWARRKFRRLRAFDP
jgi:RNA-directed DNA polymerase